MSNEMFDSNNRRRPLRLADQIKKEISKMLIKGLKDPRLDMVNITHAKVSNDLRHAKVYFRVSKETFDLDEIKKGLNSASSFIRRELLKMLEIKFIPELEFYYDDSIEYGEKIENIFKKIKNESKRESSED